MSNEKLRLEEGGRENARGVRLFVVILVAFLLLVFGKAIFEIYADWLWFVHDAKQPEVYAKTITTRAVLWVVGLVVSTLFIYLNARASLTSHSVYDGTPTDVNSPPAGNVLSALQKFAKWLS